MVDSLPSNNIKSDPATETLAKIRALEKANRVLQKKLDRTQTDLIKLEETNEKKESLLRKIIQDLNQTEQQLQNLVAGTAATTGKDFFPALVCHIAETLGVAYAVVTEQLGNELHTLGFWANGALQTSFAYQATQTPCERTLQEGQFYCERSVQQQFYPEDLDLAAMGAESYLGIALQNNQGKVLGNLCILDQKPLQNPQRAEEILRVFAARASAELERQRAKVSLERLNHDLETQVEDRTAALHTSEAQIRAIIGAIPDLLLRVAQDGTCLDYLQTHYQSEEFLPIGTHLSEVLPPELLAQQLKRIEQAITTKQIQVYDHVLQKNNHATYEEIRISALNDHEALVMVRDITQRKQSENALRKSQLDLQNTQLKMVQNEKMASLGNLVAGVAHEINNPLGFLNGSINNAQDYVKDLFSHISIYQQQHPNSPIPEQHAKKIDLDFVQVDLPKLLTSMQAATARIKGISTSLRIFSRADTSHKISIDLHEGIESTLLILKYRLKANTCRPAIEVVQDYGDLPAIECFPGQLNQVFMNILANAIDVFDEKAQQVSFEELENHPQKITIKTSILKGKNLVEICIRDNGSGIPEAVQAQIFDQLFTTKGMGEGTGLGLTIAHQIVTQTHGGSLEVQSEVGLGTEFKIRLPISS